MAVHCSRGTRAISDSVKDGSFPSNFLYESSADAWVLRVDCVVVLVDDERPLVEMTSCSVRKSGFNKGKLAPTIPRHNCAWHQMVGPMSLTVAKR